MERNRQTKIIAIVALCVAVVGLTLGFAAFSNTLTISSSATVTPNESDFKMVVYGIADSSFDGADWFWNGGRELSSSSSAISVPYLTNKATSSNAIIDNNTLTIKLSSMNFIGTGDVIEYYFKIANEGKYDAYFGYDFFGDLTNILTNQKSCIAEDGTSQEMVTNACGSVRAFADASDSSGENYISSIGFSSDYLKIPAGDYMKLYFHFTYDGSGVADGNWTIEFPDIELEFTTVDPLA